MTEDSNFTQAESNFAKEVARERQERGWTLAEMAQKLEAAGVPSMSVMSVSRVENAKRHVSMVEAGAYSKVLGRSLGDLQHPDGREALLMIFELARRRAVDNREKLFEAAKEYGDAVAILSTHVSAVEDLYADRDALDPETQQRIQNFITACKWLTEQDAITELRKIIDESWKKHGKPEAKE